MDEITSFDVISSGIPAVFAGMASRNLQRFALDKCSATYQAQVNITPLIILQVFYAKFQNRD